MLQPDVHARQCHAIVDIRQQHICGMKAE